MSSNVSMCLDLSYEQPTNLEYFYGRLHRKNAEDLLNKRGCKDGLFLLRESTIECGSYVLSICHNNKVHHYKIKRQDDDTVSIRPKDITEQTVTEKAPRFRGPIELIKFYQTESKGLCTLPSKPCNRDGDNDIVGYAFIDNLSFQRLVCDEISKFINKMSAILTDDEIDQEIKNAYGYLRFRYEKMVLLNLHLKQDWYNSQFERISAISTLKEHGLIDGSFVLRGDDAKGYKISVCYKGKISHYRIRKNTIGKSIKYNVEESEIFFDSIITLIEYYHNYSEALNTRLLSPVCAKLIYSDVSSNIVKRKSTSNNLENKKTLFINMLGSVVSIIERQSLDEFNLERLSSVVAILTSKINNP